jgi:hypothetical protein
MYLRQQIERFVEQIPDRKRARDFSTILSQVRFDSEGVCSGGALNIFHGTAVDDLREEFEQRHIEFLTQQDIDDLYIHELLQ